MPRNSCFSLDYLELQDVNDNKIGDWCTKGRGPSECFCKLCNTYFSCANKGKEQLMQHSRTAKHKGNALSYFSSKQTRLTTFPGTTTVGIAENINREWLLTESEKATRAEILWAFKVVQCNFSYASCDDLPKLFQLMFGDAAKAITMDKTKVSYLISHGLGPYITTQLTKLLISTGVYYTIEVDESTTTQVKKQLDIHVRFWDNTSSNKNVCVRYLTSVFLGHAEAVKMKTAICNSLENNGLHLSKLIMISMDGPNVNKSMWKMINEEVKKTGSPGIIDIGSCNLHIIHNAFKAGLSSMDGNKVDELAYDMHKWFHDSAARREDLKDIQDVLEVASNYVLSYNSTRWLSLVPVLKRLVEQLPALKEYFLKFLPKNNKRACESDRYKRIVGSLKDESFLPHMLFLISIGELFSGFLTLFQEECPLVHILYEKLTDIVQKLLNRFVKGDAMKGVTGTELLSVNVSDEENFLQNSKLEIGAEAKKALLSSKITDLERLAFYSNVRKFFKTAFLKLSKTLPLKNNILKDLQCLNGCNRKNAKYLDYMRRLVSKLKHSLLQGEEDMVMDDFKSYQLDPDIEESWYIEKSCDDTVMYHRVDDYWSKVFALKDGNGKPKYRFMSKVVKCALILAHGNADVERGFSFNKAIVSSGRIALKEKSICALRTVKDFVQKKGGIFQIEITKSMISSAKQSHKQYKLQLDAELEKEKASSKRIDNGKNNIATQKASQQQLLKQAFKSAENLMEEGTMRLNSALKRKDFPAASLASDLIETAKKKMKSLYNNMENTN